MSQFHVDYGDFKREDTVSSMKINLFNDDGTPITPNKSHTWVGKVVRGNKRTEKTYQILISDDDIFVPSKQMKDLPSGDYGLELWEEYDGETVIYPSAGFIGFHIHRNADDSFQSIDPTIDINQMLKSLHQAGLNVVVDKVVNLSSDDSPRVESKIEDGMNRLTFYLPQGKPGPQGPVGPQGPQGPQGDKGETGTVDNAGLTSAPAFQALQAQVNNSAVGTNLFSQSTATAGFVDGATGNVDPADSTNEIVSDYIPVSATSAYTFQMWGTTPSGRQCWSGIGLYDSNKNFISRPAVIYGVKQTSDTVEHVSQIITTTSTTAFVRVSFSKYNDYKAKLEKGSVATDWCPNPTEVLTQSDYAKIKAAIVALGGSLS